jgi:tRNA wybutosine-synthesizing protein 1
MTILLATFSLLLLLRVYLHLTSSQPQNIALRRLYDNSVEKAEPKLPINGKAAHSPKSISVKTEKADGIRRVRGGLAKPARLSSRKPDLADVQVLIFYSSIGGSTKVVASRCAEQVSSFCQARIPGFSRTVLEPTVLDLAEVEYEDYFVSPPGKQPGKPPIEYLYLMLIPSYDIDTINDTFLESLKDTHNDFRIDTAPLSSLLGYSVFGLGDRESWPSEDQGFCFQAKEVDKWLAKLTGRKRAYPMGVGDLRDQGFKRLREWTTGVIDALQARIVDGHLGEGVSGSGDAVESDVDEGDGSEDEGEVIDKFDALKRQSAKEKATG